ncbi:DUF692 family protein [bacterium]|nr:DUF692 family protein [bacterium]
MPLIATPISHLFENESYGAEIAQVSDCLEVRQRSLDSQLPKQWLFHIDIDITLKWDNETREYLQQAFNKKPELKLATLQATRCCHNELLENGMFQLSGKIYSELEMLEHAAQNTEWLRKVLNAEVKIGLENNNYYPSEAYDVVTNGDFISKVVSQNGLYLLLDIAHAMVTAHNQSIFYQDYIDSLPLDKLIQLHICQPLLPDGETAQDAHEEPNAEMMDEVIRLIADFPQIKYLTIEFYKDKDVLMGAINRLKGMF